MTIEQKPCPYRNCPIYENWKENAAKRGVDMKLDLVIKIFRYECRALASLKDKPTGIPLSKDVKKLGDISTLACKYVESLNKADDGKGNLNLSPDDLFYHSAK